MSAVSLYCALQKRTLFVTNCKSFRHFKIQKFCYASKYILVYMYESKICQNDTIWNGEVPTIINNFVHVYVRGTCVVYAGSNDLFIMSIFLKRCVK
jgi:hypothetical protein